MNRFLPLVPLLTALLLASGTSSAQQRLQINPYSTSAAPRGPADQDLNFGSITNTICFHHVPASTSSPEVSVRCGSNRWPPEPLCDDPRLREHGVPVHVGTTYFDRPHQVVVHLAFDAGCVDSPGGPGSSTVGVVPVAGCSLFAASSQMFAACQQNPAAFECAWNPDACGDAHLDCDRYADNHEWAECVRNGGTALGGVRP